MSLMAILVTVETIVLVLLTLLVAGLLRSHAEILRRLESLAPEGADGSGAGSVSSSDRPSGNGLGDLPQPREHLTPAFDIVGTTLAGDAVKVGVLNGRTNTILAFLSSGCTKCHTFWSGLGGPEQEEIPQGTRVVIVTKDTQYESPAKLRDLAPPGVPLVMSSEAWEAYGVPGSPFFVYVDGASGKVHGEGSAGNWSQVASLLRDALADQELAQAGGNASGGNDGRSRRRRMSRAAQRDLREDRELLAAGIGPGHSSFYPDRTEDDPVHTSDGRGEGR